MTVQPANGAPTAPLMPSSITQYVADYHALSELMRVAVRTDFVPKSFRPEAFIAHDNRNPTQQQIADAFEKSVASATIGAHFGMSIGVGSDPFSALQNVHVVNGKPGLYAEAAVSLVQGRGHDVWTEDLTDTRAVVCGRRKGSEHVERVVITMDQARKAGWTRNQNYQSTPQDMLYARAASRVCRRVAADALKGIHTAEELQDEAAVTSSAQAGNGTRTVQRAAVRAVKAPLERPAPVAQPAAAAAPQGPPLPGEDDPGDVSERQGHESWPISDQQWRKINARFVELGVTGAGRDLKRLAVISEIVDRLIERGGQLTAAEADLVLDNLAGTSGAELVARILNPVDLSMGDADPDTDETHENANEQTDDAETDTDQPAALEGVPDPWGINS